MSTSLEQTQTDTLQSFNVLTEWADHVIQGLPDADDEQIIHIIHEAHSLSESAFLIRGSAAMEAVKRIKARGGKVGLEISRLAKEANVAPSTIDYDRQIVETFGVATIRETGLDREYFRLALPQKDPLASINHAVEMWSVNSSYSTRDFKGDLERIGEGESKETIESEHWAKVLFTKEGWASAERVKQRRDKSLNELINDLVIEADEWHRGKK